MKIDTFVCDMIVRKLTISYSYLNKKSTLTFTSTISIYKPPSIMKHNKFFNCNEYVAIEEKKKYKLYYL